MNTAMDTKATTTTVIGSIRATIDRRRATRAHRRVLQAELGAFVTPADRLEIEMIADRYPDEQSREIREILLSQGVTG